jgi:hypothetical protein
MAVGRTTHTMTLLPNGKVLAAGGHVSSVSSTAACELYDPATGSWTATGTMATGRGNHTATLLVNGQVLVAGGYNRDGGYAVSSAELYDPNTETWTPTGSLAAARDYHAATLLLDGKVLVVGGAPDAAQYTSLQSVEVYDPSTGVWATTGSMAAARQAHTATLLPNGQVLVAGGFSVGYFSASAEIYDPAAGTWRSTGPLGVARGVHTATLLPDGTILAVGGNHNTPASPGIVTQASAEIYNPATGTWTATGSLNASRTTHTATLLPSGQVLIAGGFNYNGNFWLTSAELYSSVAGSIAALNPVKMPGGEFRFVFTGAPHGVNTVLMTTDLTLSVGNWTELGVAPESSPGLFVFSDPQAANGPQGFYRVRSP